MQPSQIAYYIALTEENKLILQVAAFECVFNVEYSLQRSLELLFKIRLTQRKLIEILNAAAKQNFFSVYTGRRDTTYTTTVIRRSVCFATACIPYCINPISTKVPKKNFYCMPNLPI